MGTNYSLSLAIRQNPTHRVIVYLSITPHCRLDTCVAHAYTCTTLARLLLATSGRAPNSVDAVAHDRPRFYKRDYLHQTSVWLQTYIHERIRATFVQQFITQCE